MFWIVTCNYRKVYQCWLIGSKFLLLFFCASNSEKKGNNYETARHLILIEDPMRTRRITNATTSHKMLNTIAVQIALTAVAGRLCDERMENRWERIDCDSVCFLNARSARGPWVHAEIPRLLDCWFGISMVPGTKMVRNHLVSSEHHSGCVETPNGICQLKVAQLLVCWVLWWCS